MKKFIVENFDSNNNLINPSAIVLNYPLIYTLLKKYLNND